MGFSIEFVFEREDVKFLQNFSISFTNLNEYTLIKKDNLIFVNNFYLSKWSQIFLLLNSLALLVLT